MSNLFSCLWFNEVDRFTSRDQLSFAYTYLKIKRMNPDRPFHLYMFKVRYMPGLFHLSPYLWVKVRGCVLDSNIVTAFHVFLV